MVQSTIVNQASFETHRKRGKIDQHLELIEPANENDPDTPLTASFDDYITRYFSVTENKSLHLIFQCDYSTSQELEILMEMSNSKDNVIASARSGITSVDAQGRLLTHPEVIVYQRANYASLMNGNVLTISTPPFLVPDVHRIRMRCRVPVLSGSPTLRIYKLGGQGL